VKNLPPEMLFLRRFSLGKKLPIENGRKTLRNAGIFL